MYKQQKAALIDVNCGGDGTAPDPAVPSIQGTHGGLDRGNEAGGLDTHPYISMGSGAAGL